jgi:hypothetical protein
MPLFLMRCLLVCFVIIFLFGTNIPIQSSELPRKEPQKWYFGQGLTAGDEFVFEICDYALRIPQSPYPCYVATLRFVTLLPTNQDEVWIVSAHLNHGAADRDIILHHTKTTHKMRTDVENIPYADSLQRTLGWINGFASQYKPQVLDVGKSWGTVTTGIGSVQLIVSRTEQTSDEKEQTYVLGYELAKNSYLQIRPGFPFPFKAQVYKPVFLQDQPLLFEFQLLAYRSTLQMCNVDSTFEDGFSHSMISQSKATEVLPNGTQTLEFSQGIHEIDDDIIKLLKEKYGQRYIQKMEQASYNFTKFIEIISQIIDSPELNNTESN